MLLVKTHPVARGIKIGSNQPPVWQSSPSPSFTLGTASNFPPSGTYQTNNYVTDQNSDPITITWLTGSVTGVTWDGGKFVYSGAGSAGTTGSLVLRATDGTDHADSAAFSIEIVSNLAWSATPSVSFVEAGVTPVNLGVYVTNYNASTDEFRVTPGYALPSWLALTPGPGTGSGNLTPNGTQVDADDVAANPGIKIDVRRSGGAWVSSPAFGVTVYLAGSGAATWSELMPMIYNANTAESASSYKQYLKSDLVDNYAEWQTLEAIADDGTVWTLMGTPVWAGFYPFAVDDETGYVAIIPG